jgi:acyl-CoA thioesterase I
MSMQTRSQPPNPPRRPMLIMAVLAAIAAIVAIALSLFLIPVFNTPVSQATPPPEIQKILEGKRKIVLLGDSVTQGGAKPGGYVWLLQKYLDTLYPNRKIEIINAGIAGDKATDMQARFQRDVLDKKPDLVAINVGVNDVWHAFFNFQERKFYPEGDLPAGVSLPIYRQKLTQMVQTAKAANIRVVLMSPTPIYEQLNNPENRRLQQYVAAMREIATENQCLFIDLNTAFREVISIFQKHAGKTFNLLAPDGVHPNEAGYRIIAYRILRGFSVPVKDIENLQLKKK